MLIKKKTDTSSLVTTTVLNTKVSEVESKIPNTSNVSDYSCFQYKTLVSEFENKIPDNSKYITTQEFNKLTTENLARN